MSPAPLTSPPTGTGWHAWLAAEAPDAAAPDVSGWRGPDGASLPPPEPDELQWLAAPAGATEPLAGLRLRRAIGRPVPRAWFRLGWAVHASRELQMYRRQRTLLLSHDLTGADELCAFGLAPGLDPREAAAAWAALLDSVLAWLERQPPDPQAPDWARERACAAPCIVELPGPREADGRAPFWQALGRHFLGLDEPAALKRHGPRWAQQLSALLPRHLLYPALLPADARAALGQVAAAAAPLQAALQARGFDWREHVGVIDGGAVLERWRALPAAR